MKFGAILQRQRFLSQLSVRQLAELSGVSFSLISAVENNRRGLGTSSVKRIADALGLPAQERKEFLKAGEDASDKTRLYPRTKNKGHHLLIRFCARVACVPKSQVKMVMLGVDEYDAVVITKMGKEIGVTLED